MPGHSGLTLIGQAQEPREVEDLEVNRMLHAGVIGRAQSDLASPVVLVPKADGILRFCVGYRIYIV